MRVVYAPPNHLVVYSTLWPDVKLLTHVNMFFHVDGIIDMLPIDIGDFALMKARLRYGLISRRFLDESVAWFTLDSEDCQEVVVL